MIVVLGVCVIIFTASLVAIETDEKREEISNLLFINNQYFTSLKSLKDFIVSLDVKKDVIYT